MADNERCKSLLSRALKENNLTSVQRRLIEETLVELESGVVAFSCSVCGRKMSLIGDMQPIVYKVDPEIEATMAGVNAMPPGTVAPVPYSNQSLWKALQRIDALVDPKAEAAKCDPGAVIVKVRQLLDKLDSVTNQREVIARGRDEQMKRADMLDVENKELRRQLREKVQR
ncbi:hypothetical protein [Anaeroselena agilis]|uniref:Uncharacterized protein n=1 Tax=Anaeroselena agilis TaxID=3063788 RepID=A0ABU3NZJ1_9FIRM|nr:hypothetical protein [Selenomonadales bacterium 4137-cl]